MNPINYLQEYCQRTKSSLPIYDVVDHQILQNTNNFTIRVSIESLEARATAPNKKTAKMKAAENMIVLMNQNNGICCGTTSNSNSPRPSEHLNHRNHTSSPNTSINSDSLNDSSSIVDGNFVGKLQEFCVQNKLIMPNYVWDSCYIGAGHKLICKLNDFSEEAIGSNKKIAKQACAEKMWLRLMETQENSQNIKQASNVTNEDVNSLSYSLEKLKVENDINLDESIEKAKLAYSQQCNIVSEPKQILIRDYHSYLKNSLTSDTRNKITRYLNNLTLDLSHGVKIIEKKLMEICSLLNVDFQEEILDSTKSDKIIVSYTINTIPSCTQVGTGDHYEVAKLKAIICSIMTIREILQ